MIRNVVLKKTLKNFIFPFISLLNQIIPKNDHWVLIYSANKGIQHSLLPLRQYLMDNGIFITKAFDICGMNEEAERFYLVWAKKTQLPNGAWQQRYY